MYNPNAIVPRQVSCKCCSGVSFLYGVADFNKNCEDRRQSPLRISGIPIYYHRCTRCGFIFTIAFDEFTNQQFLDTIYNAEYALVDPDFAEVRPAGNAGFLQQTFANDKSISILDYGGGNGLLAARLRGAGFAKVDTYDPFVAEHATRPTERYDCIVSFEVAEHTHRPVDTFREIDSLLKEDGILLFSTLLQPPDIASTGVAWWYIAPRNGHVSIYTPAALGAVINPLGLHLGSFNAGMHAACRRMPAFARHFASRAQAHSRAGLFT